jgi:phthiocerol/phenolphthiocerol synthesis type-I polyketide synthase E
MYREDFDIAVIGFAGRFAGARSLEEFEDIVFEGRTSFRQFTGDELRDEGVSERVLSDPSYKPISGYLPGTDEFDAEFFGFSRAEAELMDPQYRIFLETAYEALDRSGLAGRIRGLACSVFASCGMSLYSGKNLNSYFRNNVEPHDSLLDDFDAVQVKVLNDKDYLATQLSYRLNLKGPSLIVQTACSSSLVAVNMAVNSLRSGACDAALAGAAALHAPRKAGYLYGEGGIYSSDGRCAPFSDEATGTVGGNGVGVVILRRLGDALRDGDPIQAVIRGVAVNNDGAQKVSFTAPSLEGQRSNIAAALRDAQVSPIEIGYVEAHGTGTKIGDPIEVAALTQAFASAATERQYCAIGSVKANIGHLDTAAGIAALLKALLVLKRGEIPPQPNFKRPNPLIDFATTPFFVAGTGRPWQASSVRTALVGSLGAGGTNAHLVVSDWRKDPAPPALGENARAEMLAISAKSEPALRAYAAAYETLLETSDQPLGDICGSALTDREHFAHRLVVVGADKAEMAARLREHLAGEQPEPVFTGHSVRAPRKGVVFAFGGQGSQRVGMGRALDLHYPAFRQELDRFEKIFRHSRGRSLRELMFEDEAALLRTENAQPALFAYEWSLAALWKSFGVVPAAMIGHSVGEFVAASLAGVMNEIDAFRLVMKRGELIGGLRAPGAMLAVMLGRTAVEKAVAAENLQLDIAAQNGATAMVLSGPAEEIDAFASWCAQRDVTCKRLAVSHAFHSSLMDPVLADMREAVAGVKLKPPAVMLLSNVTGDVAGGELTDPEYWVRHLRGEVKFYSSIKRLTELGFTHFLEIGPRPTLAGQMEEADPAIVALASSGSDEFETLTEAAGRLYVHRHAVDWLSFARGRSFQRAALPTYPFQRQVYWLPAVPDGQLRAVAPSRDLAMPLRLIETVWKPINAPSPVADGVPWIVIGDAATIAAAERSDCRLFDRATAENGSVEAPPQLRPDILEACSGRPSRIVFAPGTSAPLETAARDLLALLQFAASGAPVQSLHLVTKGAHSSDSPGGINPVHTALWSMLRAARLELEDLPLSALDIAGTSPRVAREASRQIAVADAEPELIIDESGARRPELAFIDPQGSEPGGAPWEEGSSVLITGGFGEIGLYLCERLLERGAAKVILVGRSPPMAEAAKRLEELAVAKGRVIPVQCDVAQGESLSSSLAACLAPTERLAAVLHLAGNLADVSLERMTAAQLTAALLPKADGTEAVLAATVAYHPRHTVLFSSVAATFGSAGQANYAAANGYLDGVARRASREGRHVVSIAWGPWAELGMATRGAARANLAPLQGRALSNETAWQAMQAALASGAVNLLALDMAKPLQDLVARQEPLVEIARRFWSTTEKPPSYTDFADRLAKAPTTARLEMAAAEVCKAIDQILGDSCSGHNIDPARAFHDLGLDSLKVLQLRNRLNKTLGAGLVASDLYNHASAERLAGLLVKRLGGSAQPPSVPLVTQAPNQTAPEDATVDDMLRLIGEELSDA